MALVLKAKIQVLGLGIGLATQFLGLGMQLYKILTHYIDTINSLSFDIDTKLADICIQMEFVSLGYLFERILAVPASSAPVERVFSNSRLSSAHIMRKCRVIVVFEVFHLQLTVVIMSSVHG